MGLALAGLLVGLSGKGGLHLNPAIVSTKLAVPLVRMVCYLAVGLFIGQLIESLGWTGKLARVVRPMTRWANLKRESGAAFVSSFVSGIVANTMLMNAYKQDKISRTELIFTYLLDNGLPMYLVHLPTTFFIVTSLAGRAGFIYLGITFVAACFRSVTALIGARIILSPDDSSAAPSTDQAERDKSQLMISIFFRFRDRFTRLLLYAVPIYILVFLLNQWGLFFGLRKFISGWISTDLFPIESASVIIFTFAAEFSSGMAAAGALVDAGSLTPKLAGLALIIGTIVSTPIRAIRHQLPTHSGIFSLGLAGELLFLGQGFRVLTLIIISIPYAIWG